MWMLCDELPKAGASDSTFVDYVSLKKEDQDASLKKKLSIL
jgi:hypothetical protein